MMQDVKACGEVRCHRCSKYLGETAVALELVAVTNERDIKEIVKAPRSIWVCRCGWFNVFRAAA